MRQPPTPAADRRRPSADRSRDDRRTRTRLRDLCDEVLASYRVARGEEPLSVQERAAASELLARVAPPIRG